MALPAGSAHHPIPTTYLDHKYEEFQGLEEGFIEVLELSPPSNASLYYSHSRPGGQDSSESEEERVSSMSEEERVSSKGEGEPAWETTQEHWDEVRQHRLEHRG